MIGTGDVLDKYRKLVRLLWSLTKSLPPCTLAAVYVSCHARHLYTCDFSVLAISTTSFNHYPDFNSQHACLVPVVHSHSLIKYSNTRRPPASTLKTHTALPSPWLWQQHSCTCHNYNKRRSSQNVVVFLHSLTCVDLNINFQLPIVADTFHTLR